MSIETILNLPSSGALNYLLKEGSFFTSSLPSYFNFETLLRNLNNLFDECDFDQNINSLIKKAKNQENVNYSLLKNKDGKLSWRPLQLIHPVIYVILIRKITKEENFLKIKEKFLSFQKNLKIKCCSLSSKTDFYNQFILSSVELGLEYEFLFETDISECYPSIYTHSIAWAIEGKEEAKSDKADKTLLGSQIDNIIQSMQYGQTNGIPQGSIIMDLLAELLLGYLDTEIIKALEDIEDYQILRYRDDYRIFTKNINIGEEILKRISEVLSNFGLKLNTFKTNCSHNLILGSFKKDWLAWDKYPYHPSSSIIKNLLLIKQFSEEFPNSGSLKNPLKQIKNITFKEIEKNIKFITKNLEDSSLKADIEEIFKSTEDSEELKIEKAIERGRDSSSISHFNKNLNKEEKAIVSILVDISFYNPSLAIICFSIISLYILLIKQEEKEFLAKHIKEKFDKSSYTGYIEILLQRIFLKANIEVEYNQQLCSIAIIEGTASDLWSYEWIETKKIIKELKKNKIVDIEILKNLTTIMKIEEMELDDYWDFAFIENPEDVPF